MNRIAVLLAAGVIAAAPAAFAKPGEQAGKEHGKGHAAGSQGSGKSHGQGHKASGGGSSGAAVKARTSVRTDETVVRRTSGQGGGSWSYRGREYDQFDVPAYRLPPGQAKKIFNQGQRLPAAYYAQNRTYVLANPGQYELPVAPSGYQWVRVDNDAYLVRSQTGVISDVIRSIFR